MNYNYLFDLTPISKDEHLICSDYLIDQEEDFLGIAVRYDYNCIDLYKNEYQEPRIKVSSLFIYNESRINAPFGRLRRILRLPLVRRIYPML